jgi:hypothetical protein
LAPPSLEQLAQRVRADVLANPPLEYEPEDAAAAAAAEAVHQAEVATAAGARLFDVVIAHDPDDSHATLGRLSELLHTRYPTAAPATFVWGLGRPLWDARARIHGRRQLRIVLLGPAASGKTTLSALLASRCAWCQWMQLHCVAVEQTFIAGKAAHCKVFVTMHIQLTKMQQYC